MEFYPKSSRIRGIAYDPDNMELEVTFMRGGVYRYFGVPLEVYTELVLAESVGKAFQRLVIEANFDFQKL